MFDNMSLEEIIKLAAPLIIVELILMITCIRSLIIDEVNYVPKWAWLLVIFLVNPLGAIAYLIFGRKKV